jgi:uncharacterized protein YjiS (DUF1127 family)
MKYRSFENDVSWSISRDWPRELPRQMVPPKSWSECRAGRSETAGRMTPRKAPRRSQLRALVDCLTLTRETLDFGSPFIFAEPQVQSRELGGGLPKRPTSALVRWFASWRRELAIARGVADIRRLDDRTLRDIGIVDRSAIESFVRNGRDVGTVAVESTLRTRSVSEEDAVETINLALAGLTPVDVARARAWMLARPQAEARTGRTAQLPVPHKTDFR